MTQVLRITTEDRAESYDILSGPICKAWSGYRENNRGGLLERTYAMTGRRGATRLELMEAYKEIEVFGRRAEDKKAHPSRTKSIWLDEAAEGETPIKRSRIDSVRIRLLDRAGIEGMLTTAAIFAELTVTTTPFSESEIRRTLSDLTPDALAGTFAVPAGGTVDGRLERLSFSSGPSVSLQNVWVGIRPVNDGTADFESFIPSSSNNPLTTPGVTKITDVAAFNGEAIQIEHGTVTNPHILKVRHLTSTGIAYPSNNPEHFNGRYRAIIRYRVLNATGPSAGRNSVIIALKLYYGPVSLDRNPGIPLETLYINGTDGLYRLLDAGEINIPHYGNLARETSLGGCGFAYATEFIEGDIDEDHLIIDGVCLMPADRLATLTGMDEAAGTQVYWFTNDDDTVVVAGQFATAAEGTNSLNMPAEGGIGVVLAEDGTQSLSGATTVNLRWLDRYGRYAGNG